MIYRVPVMDLDICLIAGRRPDLLKATLESFQRRLFGNFQIRNFYANIDPIFGTGTDGQAAADVIRSFFPKALITMPEEPGFCAAVQRNWSATSAEFVLHLEDDWLLNVDITPDIVTEFGDPQIAQVAFHSAEKNWDMKRRGKFHYCRRPVRVFGLPLPIKPKFPRFTTSPSFLRGAFARNAAKLFDVRLDPEKQFYSRRNSALERYVAPLRSSIFAIGNGFVVHDIGREWREQRGIRKSIEQSTSVWTVET